MGEISNEQGELSQQEKPGIKEELLRIFWMITVGFWSEKVTLCISDKQRDQSIFKG